MATERDRASFEHWHIQRQRSRGYGAFLSDAEFVTRDESGRYRTLGLDDALEAWCAALAAPPVDQPSIEDLCARIKAADDAAADNDYMLDSDDCIRVLRGTWTGPLAMDKPEQPAPQALSAPDSERAARAKAMTAAQVAKLLRWEAVCAHRMNVWQLDRAAELLEAQPAPQAGAAEPVAWMHDEPGRVDVIHHKVKELLEDQHAKGYSSPDYMHRPLGKVEHYTIPLYAHPDATEEFVGYLCCAWGESDRPVAELVRDLESVGRFMVKHWLGDEGAEDYDGTPTLPRLMTEWQDHDWDNEWSADFEICGVSVERLHCAVPAARAAQAQGEKGEQG